MLLIAGLMAGLFCLFLGGDWLVDGSSRLAESFGISPLVVGLTVVALGTSSPELLVSVSAALSGSSDIAVGNVVGSSIANIGLILGLSGIIFPISIKVTLIRREIPIMLVAMIVATLMLRDGLVSRTDAGILIVGLFAFIGFMIVTSRQEQDKTYDIPEEESALDPENLNRMTELGRLVLGIVVLMVGAQLTVGNATELARNIGISELVIGVTVIAIGTSLPELVTSVVAAANQKSDIAIGNVVGSNIFNVLAILGTTALIQPVNVSAQTITVDSLVMVGFGVLMLPFVLDRKLGRYEAMVFLIGYIGFTLYVVYDAITVGAL